jgi:hypothetical protein
MPLRDLNDAKHWHGRTAEMRVLAEGMMDSNATRLMHDLGNDYDKLAYRDEERAKSGFDFSFPSPLRSQVSKEYE